MRILITPTAPKNPYINLLQEALETQGFQVATSRTSAYNLFWNVAFKHQLPEIVHLQWQSPYFARRRSVISIVSACLFFIQWSLLRLCGVKFVWTVHNLVNHEKRAKTIELWASRLLFRCVDHVVVHCDEALQLVSHTYAADKLRQKILVVPIGPLGDWYVQRTETKPKDELLASLGFAQGDKILLYFGLIRPYKQVPQLIKQFRVVAGKDVRLIIAGRPASEQLESDVMTAAAGDERLLLDLQFVPDQQLMDYIRVSDIVILPYRNILTSSVLTLASSLSKPVVIPQIGCLKDFTDEASIKYDPNREEGFVEALQQAIQLPPQTLAQMGEKGYAFSQVNSWEVAAQRLAALYEQLA